MADCSSRFSDSSLVLDFLVGWEVEIVSAKASTSIAFRFVVIVKQHRTTHKKKLIDSPTVKTEALCFFIKRRKLLAVLATLTLVS